MEALVELSQNVDGKPPTVKDACELSGYSPTRYYMTIKKDPDLKSCHEAVLTAISEGIIGRIFEEMDKDPEVMATKEGLKIDPSSVAEKNNKIKHLRWYLEKQNDAFSDGKKEHKDCLLYTSPSPRDGLLSRMPSSA